MSMHALATQDPDRIGPNRAQARAARTRRVLFRLEALLIELEPPEQPVLIAPGSLELRELRPVILGLLRTLDSHREHWDEAFRRELLR